MTGQVTVDEALRNQLAALLHDQWCLCGRALGCIFDGDGRLTDAADAVLSWLLSQGTTETRHRSNVGLREQRQVLSVSSVWTTVEGTP